MKVFFFRKNTILWAIVLIIVIIVLVVALRITNAEAEILKQEFNMVYHMLKNGP